jgi:hypothetical protein
LICRHPACPDARIRLIDPPPSDQQAEYHGKHNRLSAYLHKQQNLREDIDKLYRLLDMPRIILEIGCGNCDIARQIALKNPALGVIATDQYAWDAAATESSHYQQMAQKWRATRLLDQQSVPPNLVILKAEAQILSFLPDLSLESILLVNPEPIVAQAFLAFIASPTVYAKLKPGNKQIVVAPFSREMGMVACGGFEFDHSEDWSMGLGFMMSSEFQFKRANKIQWGVDLRSGSPYSKNSTQSNVYLYGNQP